MLCKGAARPCAAGATGRLHKAMSSTARAHHRLGAVGSCLEKSVLRGCALLSSTNATYFPDNWIDGARRKPKLAAARTLSPSEAVLDDTRACPGLEYCCFAGEGLCTSSEAALLVPARSRPVPSRRPPLGPQGSPFCPAGRGAAAA